MATKVVTLFERLAHRGLIIRKTPQAWSSVSVWGHIFGYQEHKEEEEEEEKEDCAQISEREYDDASVRRDVQTRALTPVTTAEIIRARQDFAKDYWKNLLQGGTRLFVSNNSRTPEDMTRYSNDPPITVGDDDSYRYLPQ